MKKRWERMLRGAMAVLLSVGVLAGGFRALAADTEENSRIPREAIEREERLKESFYIMDEDSQMRKIKPTVGLMDEAEIDLQDDSGIKVVNFNTKGLAVTEYLMEGVTNASGQILSGYTNGGCGADAAYLGMEGDRVRFMQSGVVGLVHKDEVQVVDFGDVKNLSGYEITGGWLRHWISFNMKEKTNPEDGSENGAWIRVGYAPDYMKAGVTYYSYDGHYFYTDYKVMLEDYKKETREHSVNPNMPHYNYYQYLPFRASSSYSGAELTEILDTTIKNNFSSSPDKYETSKMKGLGEEIVKVQNIYGVNALITAGIAANESGWGTSSICQKKNNLFGLNAVDSSPGESADTFESPKECVEEFASYWMSKGYLNPKDWRHFGGFLGDKASGINVKYGSDPYWGEKAASIAWQIDRAGGERDYQTEVLAVKDVMLTTHTDVPIYVSAGEDAKKLYSTGKQAGSAYILLSSSPVNGFYKIQTDGILNKERTGLVDMSQTDGSYSRESMYGYIRADALTIVNTGKRPQEAADFEDVTKDAWYYPYVEYVFEKGMMTGMNNRYFGVMEKMRRAHIVTIIYRMEKTPASEYKDNFPDISKGDFYANAAAWASSQKIMTGYDNGYFGGNDAVNREQMVTVLYRYAQDKGIAVTNRADLSAYADAGNVSGFAVEAFQWAVAEGIVKGDQGLLNPQGEANRAECSAMFARFQQNYIEK